MRPSLTQVNFCTLSKLCNRGGICGWRKYLTSSPPALYAQGRRTDNHVTVKNLHWKIEELMQDSPTRTETGVRIGDAYPAA